MTFPKLCRECKYAVLFEDRAWDLKCNNVYVNANDSWALASGQATAGTDCRSERERIWFAPCGKKGKRWEQK